MKKILLTLLILIILGIIAIQLFGTNTPSQDEITIGAILPLSGEGVADGEDTYKAMELAREDLAQEGISVNILYEDDATSPHEAVSALKKLKNQHVEAVVGGVWSFLAEPLVPLSKTEDIVVISPTATKEFVAGTSTRFFLGGAENRLKSDVLTPWMNEHDVKTAAIIVSKDSWGVSNKVAFENTIKNVGGEVVISEEILFGNEVSTLPTVLAKIATLKPDVILWTGYEPGAVTLIRRMQETDINIPVIAATAGMAKVIKEGKVVLDGSFDVYSLDYNVPSEFTENFFTRYNEYPMSSYAHRAYDAVKILAYEMSRDSEEPLHVRVRNTDHKGYAGVYSFDENGYFTGESTWVINEIE